MSSASAGTTNPPPATGPGAAAPTPPGAAHDAARPGGAPASAAPDIAEHGARGQRSDRRLFMQFQAFDGCADAAALGEALGDAGVEGAVYEDVHRPRGVAAVGMHEDPDFFVETWRRVLGGSAFATLTPRPELTMFGRTYAIGYESDLEDTLLRRPRRTVLNPDWPWAIWYPLRRRGAFMRLPEAEQQAILREHGTIGMAFGRADLAHDVRLACHGLDVHDNDFVIGLVGRELYPLSAIVQAMRRTKQTSQYLERLGPFFVGRVAWRSE